jgi:putative polyketide hydroxylase
MPSTFPIGARVAEAFRVHRVFLAGDAAHLMPPTGGLGGTTAVEDAHNLAWKLALVLRGHAEPALLDTYTAERRPVAVRAVRQAFVRARDRWGLPAEEVSEALRNERPEDFYSLVFGNTYRSAAVLGAPDGDGGAATGEADHVGTPLLPLSALTGAPGSRAPHVTVAQDGGEPLSTLDLYGRGLVLLAGPDGDAWQEAAARVSTRLPASVETYHLDEELAAPHGLETGGALLVRPDGYVAWRTKGGRAAGPGAEACLALEKALRAVLGHPRAEVPLL